MGRMTIRTTSGIALLAPAFEERYSTDDLIDVLLDRLAAYEDTGLEPEEIKNLKTGIIPAHWGELFYAEAEGRLLVLPCKVGDTVYTAQRGVISELSVDHLELYNVGIWVGWHLISGIYGNFRMDGFPASDIGKTVFLTREEAEAALMGGSDNL